MIAFGAPLWPVLLGAYHGFRSVEPPAGGNGRVLMRIKAGGVHLEESRCPARCPTCFAGVRVSLAIALILAVVTEMQAAQSFGLGFNILMAQRSFRSPELYAGIIVLGVLGLFTNQALIMAERRILRWRTLTR